MRRLLVLALLGACAAPPAAIEYEGDGGPMAYECHEAVLRRDTEGRWRVTLLRRDRSGGPAIHTYPDEIVESIVVPMPDELAEGARIAFDATRPVTHWHEPMVRGASVKFDRGEGVVESWDPEKRRLTGRFSATRRAGERTWTLRGTFDAAYSGE